MKIKLLSFSLLVSFYTSAQEAITSYYGDEAVAYTVAFSASPLDESEAGADVEWNFDLLLEAGTSISQTIPATPEEIEDYPNTTDVTVTTALVEDDEIINRIFSYTDGGEIYITGTNTTEIELYYNTDNANLGVFPQNFGDSHTDVIAGTYVAEGYTGTFTGTCVTAVDAYGTLTVNLGEIEEGTPVTRLKTEQDIALSFAPFGEVGTVTQTTYSYYNSEFGSFPIFRSTNTHIVVDLLDVDYTTTSIETFEQIVLGMPSHSTLAKPILSPNPVQDSVSLNAAQNSTVYSVVISDINGRAIKRINTPGNEADLSELQSGIYFAEINTSSGSSIQKIIKK